MKSDGEMDRPPCAIEDCGKPAERVTLEGVALCAMHRKRLFRLRRGMKAPAMAAPAMRGGPTPLERVIVAADSFLEVSSEDDHAYDLALERFRTACAHWMRSLGWSPPPVLRDVDPGASPDAAPGPEALPSPSPLFVQQHG